MGRGVFMCLADSFLSGVPKKVYSSLKPKVWEHCCISWGGTKSPKSKACDSSLASSSPSNHPTTFQTLSESCQVSLLNISGICALPSVLGCRFPRTSLLYLPCAIAATVPFRSSCLSRTHAGRWRCLKMTT